MTFTLKWKFTDALLGLGVGTGYLIVMTIMPGLAIGLPSVPQALTDVTKGFIIIAIAPILEEILFRGVIFGALKSVTAWIIAAVVSALAFAAFHLYVYQGQIGALLAAFVFSFAALASLYLSKEKNLLSPIIVHMVANAYIWNSAFSLLTIAR